MTQARADVRRAHTIATSRYISGPYDVHSSRLRPDQDVPIPGHRNTTNVQQRPIRRKPVPLNVRLPEEHRRHATSRSLPKPVSVTMLKSALRAAGAPKANKSVTFDDIPRIIGNSETWKDDGEQEQMIQQRHTASTPPSTPGLALRTWASLAPPPLKPRPALNISTDCANKPRIKLVTAATQVPQPTPRTFPERDELLLFTQGQKAQPGHQSPNDDPPANPDSHSPTSPALRRPHTRRAQTFHAGDVQGFFETQVPSQEGTPLPPYPGSPVSPQPIQHRANPNVRLSTLLPSAYLPTPTISPPKGLRKLARKVVTKVQDATEARRPMTRG